MSVGGGVGSVSASRPAMNVASWPGRQSGAPISRRKPAIRRCSMKRFPSASGRTACGRVAPVAPRVKRDPLRKFATAECGHRFHAETRRWPDRRSATPRGPQRLPRAVVDFSWTADRWPISASRPSLASGTASIALFLIRPEVRSPLRSANARRRRCRPWVTTAELTQHNAS